MTTPTEAVARAMARATAPTLDDGDGWETTAAVLAFEVGRLRDALDASESRALLDALDAAERREAEWSRRFEEWQSNNLTSWVERAERAEAALARVTDAMVEAAWQAAYEVGIESPYMARVSNYSDVDALQAADVEADRKNDEAMRAVLRAALNGADA